MAFDDFSPALEIVMVPTESNVSYHLFAFVRSDMHRGIQWARISLHFSGVGKPPWWKHDEIGFWWPKKLVELIKKSSEFLPLRLHPHVRARFSAPRRLQYESYEKTRARPMTTNARLLHQNVDYHKERGIKTSQVHSRAHGLGGQSATLNLSSLDITVFS